MNPKEKFLNDVSGHQLELIKDDGLYRHIKFSKPDSSDMWFGIVTWPEYLCIHSDMGDFVFSRLTDMFEFFRRNGDDWDINLDDFFLDSNFESYTRQYIWCCHAIVWAIQQYDAQKQAMTGKLSFSMNGFRQNLSEDLQRLKESVINVANQEYFITEELVDDTNAVICASNALNCVWVSGDEHFKNMEDVELDLIEFDGETAS